MSVSVKSPAVAISSSVAVLFTPVECFLFVQFPISRTLLASSVRLKKKKAKHPVGQLVGRSGDQEEEQRHTWAMFRV